MNDQFRETEAAARYAKAAFELAQDGKVLDKVHGDLAALRALLLSSNELRTFVASQVYKSDVKLNGLLAVAQDKTSGGLKLNDLTRKTLSVLAANRRMSEILPFITSFNRLYAAHKGIVSADVISAVPLTAAQLEDLKTALGKTLGHAADISTSVDPALLGGLKVRVGSRLFDASLKTKLDSLKFALKRA